MYRIFIDGKEGTTGLRIYERIAECHDIELLLLSDEERKNASKRQEMIHASDITFLCLPDVAAKEAVALAAGSNAKIIDASTAHRTLADWSYGLPEFSAAQHARIANSSRTAVPGCHASGFIALISPLLQAGLLSKEALLSCTSLTGYSGGGKQLIAAYESPTREAGFSSPRLYALGQTHKHLKEMHAITGLALPPVFMPVLGDFYAGMLVSIPLHASMLAKKCTLQELQTVYAAHYENQPVIDVLPCSEETAALCANALAGKDNMQLLVTGNDERICLTARYDNLGKGASGAAVQCMNIMLGRSETANLNL